MNIAIIGCGAIGTTLVKALCRKNIECKLITLFDINPDKCFKSLETCSNRSDIEICSDIDCVIRSKPEIVVEAASQKAVQQYVPKLLEHGINVVILSVGALFDEKTYKELELIAKKTRSKIYIPSGAIAGLDAIKTLSRIGIDRIVLRTTKSFKSLGVEENSVKQIDKIKLFEGKASEAVKLYPVNINVAATLSLAVGRDIDVEIYGCKNLDVNIHEIIVESNASKIYIRVENKPHPSNPRTSYLAALSIIQLLNQICKNTVISIGT